MNLQYLGITVRESLFSAAVGYVVGHLSQTSPEKVAVVFAISMVASRALIVFNFYITSDKTSDDGLKNFHNTNLINSAAIGCVTAVALQRMQLLSGNGAYCLALFSIFTNVIQMKS